MKTHYSNPNLTGKLTKSDVINALNNGATLTKLYGVYSYYMVTFSDGTKHYNIRKGACEGISTRTIEGLVRTEIHDNNGKISGFSYKMRL